MAISTSIWSAQHPNAGRNIQQTPTLPHSNPFLILPEAKAVGSPNENYEVWEGIKSKYFPQTGTSPTP